MTREAGEGKVSEESIGEARVSALEILGRGRTGPPAVAGDALHRKLDWSIACGGGQMYITGRPGNENGNAG